jgi:beta-lactamase regulating signal transducer with metallopeptidase domain
MQTASRLAVDYAINALWQLPLLVLAAEVTVRLLGRAGGKTLFRVWVACLLLALTVPALPFLHVPAQVLNYGSTHVSVTAPARAGAPHLSFSGKQFDSPAQIDRRTTEIPNLILNCALYFYAASVLFAVIRLMWGLVKTRSLLHSAQATILKQGERESWESCLKLFGKARIKLMSSSRLAGPATVSWPGPIVLLPAKLRDEDANDMTAVFCHELAHVQRNDFLYNIFLELFGVLLFYHPAFHWMRRRIQETRELACDDLAADAMAGRHVYAQSLLRLTQKMLSAAVLPQPGCALGIFEGEILEKRIMNLLEKQIEAFSSSRLHFTGHRPLPFAGNLLVERQPGIEAGERANSDSGEQRSLGLVAGWNQAGQLPNGY